MAGTPQKEDGFTPIANEIMEALMRVNLSAYESRVLWFLFRKTYGWNKKTDWITLSQFSECIGLDRRLIHRAIKSLSSKKMIVIYRDDTFKIRYGFQKDFKKWKLSSKKMTVINKDDGVSSKEMTRLSSIQIPTRESITKETIQKKNTLSSGKPNLACPQKEIIELYHTILPELPQVRTWPESNQKILRTRWKEEPERQNLSWWESYFKYIHESTFLTGRETDFTADLEWVVRPKNMTKIINGRYHKQKHGGIMAWLTEMQSNSPE